MPWAVVLAMGLWAGRAEAADPETSVVQLEWSAPQGCADEAEVRSEIERRLHDTSARPLVVSGVVHADDDRGWLLELRLREAATDAVEERQLRAESCAGLARAAGLLIAIAADPGPASNESNESDESNESNEPSDAALPSRVVPPPDSGPDDTWPLSRSDVATTPPRAHIARHEAVATRASTRAHGMVRIEGIGQIFRVLPGVVSGGIAGAAGLSLPRAQVEARGRYYVRQRASYNEPPNVGGEIDLWTVGSAACWMPAVSKLELPVCGGLELGRTRARSFGLRDNSVGRSVWAAATLEAAVAWWPVAWLGLRAGPELAVALRRPRFHVRDLPGLFRAGPVGLRLVGGVEVRFP